MAFSVTKTELRHHASFLAGLVAGIVALCVPGSRTLAQGTQNVTGTVFGNTTPVNVNENKSSATSGTAFNNAVETETVSGGGSNATHADGTIYIEVPTYQPYAHLGGSLTSVTATFTGTSGVANVTATGSTITYSFKNTSGFTQNYTITGQPMTLTLFQPTTTAGSAATTTLTTSASSAVTAYNPGNVANNATSTDATAEPYTFTASGTISDPSLTAGGNNLAVWSGYTGKTTMYFDVFAALTDTITTNIADPVATDLSTWLLQSSVTVTYTYQNRAPEPGTWALFVSFASAAGILVRRRKARRRVQV